MNADKLLNQIKIFFKDPIQKYKIITEGCWNIVIEINGEWIFRFSRSDNDIKQLALEKMFLPKFKKISSVAIPDITYKWKNFIGYKKIEGERFTYEIYKQLSSKNKNEICKSIGEFLTQLHSIKFENKNLTEFPLWDTDFWNDLWKPIESQLSSKTRENALNYFMDYFTNEAKYPIEKTICHWDIHPNHIFFNTSSENISWIIDFGRLCINDPAVDFNLFERFFGEDMVNTIIKYYNREIPVNFKKRIAFQNKRRLFSAIYYANSINQQESIPRYIKRIEDTFY